jgi:hypothetical protein
MMRPTFTASAALLAIALAPAAAHAQDAFDDFELGAPALVTPSFNIAYGFGAHHGPDGMVHDVSGLALYLGANLYPMAAPLTPYLGLGVEAEWTRIFDGRDATYIMPTAKLGMAWLGCYDEDDTIDYVEATFACLSVYALGAVRPPSFERDASVRMGVGFNSPLITVGGAAAEVILPSGLEFYVEVEPDGSTASFIRVQLGF